MEMIIVNDIKCTILFAMLSGPRFQAFTADRIFFGLFSIIRVYGEGG